MKLFGKNPVIERLRTYPSSIQKMYIQQGLKDAGLFYEKARQKMVPLIVVPKDRMLKMTRGVHAQGVMAEVEDFSYDSYEDLLETALKKDRCLIFLDELNDPQNLGAIIRTSACLGRFSVVLSTHHCVEITPAVLRVACGGENYVPVAKVPNLTQAIRKAKEQGFHMVGAVVKEGLSIYDISLSFPLGLVVGSEQKGIRDVIRKEIDTALRIPMTAGTLSLNVAQATSLICYEITRQRSGNHKKH